MTRKDAIELVKSAFDAWEYQYDTGDDWSKEHEARDMAIESLERTLWIPVSERLPEESLNSVIGWDTYRERCVFVQYINSCFQITGSDESFDIVAWMPLPEPYVPDINVGKMAQSVSTFKMVKI